MMRISRVAGVISLPVLLLLLFVMALNYQFNQQQAKQRQWYYQQNVVLDEQAIWQAFEYQVIAKLKPEQASLSLCLSFCLLDLSESKVEEWPNRYQYRDDSLIWLFEKEDTLVNRYRLCAKRVMYQSAYCWWLSEVSGNLNWYARLPINGL